VAEDEGDALFGAEVGEPVPGEHALAGNGVAVAEGIDSSAEGVGGGGDGLGEDGLAGSLENVQGQGSGVQIDAAIESVLLVVESHHGVRGIG
jgi:hypothetical protein